MISISSENMGSILGYLRSEKVGDNPSANGTQLILTRRTRFCSGDVASAVSLFHLLFHLRRLFDRCGPGRPRTSVILGNQFGDSCVTV